MVQVRVIIAAGRATDSRWKLYKGVAKQLVPIGSERLIERTIRQFSACAEVLVTHPPGHRLPLNGTRQVEPRNDPVLGDINGVLNSRAYWSHEDRTIVALGDVYFSDFAIRTITASRRDWALYGRAGASSLTGKTHDEQFAIGFMPEEHDKIVYAAYQAARLWQRRRIRWVRFPQLYHSMLGYPPERIDRRPEPSAHFVTIDDESDDIDYPADYERLLKRLTGSVIRAAAE